MIAHGPSCQKTYTLLPGLSLLQSAAKTNSSLDSFQAQMAFASAKLPAEPTVSNCGQVRLKASRNLATVPFTAISPMCIPIVEPGETKPANDTAQQQGRPCCRSSQFPVMAALSACMFPFTSVTQPGESLRGAAGEVFRSGEVRPLAADRPLRV